MSDFGEKQTIEVKRVKEWEVFFSFFFQGKGRQEKGLVKKRESRKDRRANHREHNRKTNTENYEVAGLKEKNKA